LFVDDVLDSKLANTNLICSIIKSFIVSYQEPFPGNEGEDIFNRAQLYGANSRFELADEGNDFEDLKNCEMKMNTSMHNEYLNDLANYLEI